VNSKIFEIRDRMTCIVAFGTKLEWSPTKEGRMLGMVGYTVGHYIVLTRLAGGVTGCHDDPHEWGRGERTMSAAHQYIHDHWDELPNGAIVDVEFVLGESKAPKETQFPGDSLAEVALLDVMEKKSQ
jgi:hypothetical protein